MEMDDAHLIIDVLPEEAVAEWQFTAAGESALLSPIPEELAAQFVPATHTVLEWVEYGVSFPGATEITVGGISLKHFAADWFVLKFENQLGLAELRAFDRDGRLISPPCWLLVLSKKFPTIKEHVAFYEPLLDDLFIRIAHLPFTFAAPTGQQVQEAMRPPGPLFTLHFLTQEAERIATAIRVIQASPHRRLTSEESLLPLHAVSTIDADSLLEIASAPHRWREAATSTLPLRRRASGNLPESVWQRVSVETLDTPENRFVLAAIRQFAQALHDLKRQSWWLKIPRQDRQVLDALASTMGIFMHDPRFVEVGPFTRPPASSRVLLRKEGYRDLFALWGLFQRSRRPLFGALEAAMAVRDVATLYEQWVYFRLIDDIARLLDETPVLSLTSSGEDAVGWNASANFGVHGVLRYNATRTAYSKISLRPDMLWEPAIGRPVALDAKFRLQPVNDSVDRWKEDDLVKMHAYRDALNIRAALVIYPGDLTEFWPANPDEAITMFNELIDGTFSGVGAIALQPQRAEVHL
jgi:predicted component of viral defense system (DUF524 family)